MNKTAFIIGNGPSLNEIDISLLADQDTMSFNRAYIAYEEWGFDPTYYLTIDGNTMLSVIDDVHELVRSSNIKKFFILGQNGLIHHHPDRLLPTGDNVFHLEETAFPNSATRVPDIQEINGKLVYSILPNAGINGLAILRYLGYEEVAFVGQDARYVDDTEYRDVEVEGWGKYKSFENNDKNHFRSDYFGEDCYFGKPNQDQIISLWAGVKNWIDAQENFSVYSCTPNSNLNPYYKYIPLEQFIKGER